MKYLLYYFTVTFQGQVLHHQMISGARCFQKLTDGVLLSQTIGQNSSVGTSSFDYVIQQDFNRVLGKYIAQIHPRK
jgi:hypothetical protein